MTLCMPWQDGAEQWPGYGCRADAKHGRRYLQLDLGSHEEGAAAARAAKQEALAADRAAAGCELRRCARLRQEQAQGQGQRRGQQASAAS